MEKQFDLEHHYQEYLKMVKLKESEMGATQRTEMKRVFMGACGQMLVMLRDELSKLDEDVAIGKLQAMFDQVGNYFLKETNKQN